MQYYILAVSKKAAHLYKVSDGNVAPVPVDGMPSGIDDALKGMEREEKSLQFHSSGGKNAMFHGDGGAKDVREQEEDVYYHAVAKSLHKVLHEQHLPVVIAGVQEAYGMLRSFDKSGRIIEEYIQGSPDNVSYDDLKAKADPMVEKYILTQNEKFLEQYGALQGTGRTSTDAQQIGVRADEGKVDLLLVAQGSEADYKEEAAHTREHGGTIAVIADDKMPEGSKIAAVLRY
jgi:hypothetical protein